MWDTTLGSAVKGETTPYSDLEFFILIKESSEDIVRYFETLSMSMYFLIGNLGETNLKYMNIEELHQDKWFEDLWTNGFKIDGLLPYAGNIPTGNGCKTQSKNRFIKTVEEMVKDYVDVFDNPDEETAIFGNLSTMMAFTKHIVGGEAIHGRFRTTLELISPSMRRQLASQNTLVSDMKKFDFDFTDDITRLIDLKTGIYRYPSLLVHDLKVIKQLQAESAWDAIDLMADRQIISKDVSLSLKFALATAQYVRLAAYIHHRSQVNHISVLAREEDSGSGSGPWHFRRQLLTSFVFHLIPIKVSLSHGRSGVSGLITEIRIDEELLLPLVSYYCEDYAEMLNQIGEDKTRWFKMNDHLKGVYLTALLENSSFAIAQEAIEEIYGKCDSDPLASIQKKTWQAQIFEKKSQFQEACRCYKDKLMIYETILGNMNIGDVASTWTALADMQCYAGKLYESLDSVKKSLEIRPDSLTSLRRKTLFLMILGRVREATRCGKEFLDQSKLQDRQYQDGGAAGLKRPDVADAYFVYGRALSEDGDYNLALKKYQKGLRMYHRLHGSVNHMHIAFAYAHVGVAHKKLGDLDVAARYLKKSEEMYNCVSDGASHPNLAFVKQKIGDLERQRGNFDKALEASESSLRMTEVLFGNHPHKDVAFSHESVGRIFRDLKEPEEALLHFEQGLEIRREAFKPHGHSSIVISLKNISKTYSLYRPLQDNYTRALEFYKAALEEADRLGVQVIDQLKVELLAAIRAVSRKIIKTLQALDSRRKTLVKVMKLYDTRARRSKAFIYLNIGDHYEALNDLEKAKSFYVESWNENVSISPTDETIYKAIVSKKLSHVLKRLKSFDEALKYAHLSLECNVAIRLSKGEPNFHVADCHKLIGEIHECRGDEEEALISYQNSLRVHGKVNSDRSRHQESTLLRKIRTVQKALRHATEV